MRLLMSAEDEGTAAEAKEAYNIVIRESAQEAVAAHKYIDQLRKTYPEASSGPARCCNSQVFTPPLPRVASRRQNPLWGNDRPFFPLHSTLTHWLPIVRIPLLPYGTDRVVRRPHVVLQVMRMIKTQLTAHTVLMHKKRFVNGIVHSGLVDDREGTEMLNLVNLRVKELLFNPPIPDVQPPEVRVSACRERVQSRRHG